MQLDCRAGNPGIRKEDDELRLDCWIQIRLTFLDTDGQQIR